MEINYSYRKLNAYKYARALVIDTYRLIDKFPKTEMYALSDQLRRAIVSVPSNIAEGLSRTSNKEKSHFLDIAYGSLMESHCQLEIAVDLKYISEEEFQTIEKKIDEEAAIIAGMRKKLMDTKAGSRSDTNN